MTSKQISSSLISSIYNSRKVVLELFENQKYNVKDYKNFSINEVNMMSQNNQFDMLIENEETQKKIYVRYYLGKVLKQQILEEIIDDLFHLITTSGNGDGGQEVEEAKTVLEKKDILFIIIKDDINDTLTALLKQIWEQDGIFIIIQSLKRLQFNILNHSLVPPHRIMTPEEVTQVKTKYNIMNDSQFPEISRFDPVAQSICIRPGEVCEILRPSKTAIESKYYRICV